jgi:hypothetical protein
MAVSAIDAVAEKYSGLPGGIEAVLWFGQAQLKLPGGGTTSLPVVEYYHENPDDITTCEATCIQLDTFRMEVWAETLATCRSIMETILFGDADPEDRAGFWYPLTFPTPTGWEFLSCDPIGLPQYEDLTSPTSANATQIHHGVLRFTTQFRR